MSALFEPVLAQLSDRHRDEVLAAFAAVENSPEPVKEAPLPGLNDATLRRCVQEMLELVGRTLVRVGQNRWISGYRDENVARVTAHSGNPLPAIDRAVLTLILIHAVAIPRTDGTLAGDGWMRDSWVDGIPVPIEELQRRSQVPVGELQLSLSRLRAAGLVRVIAARSRPGTTPQSRAYAPGPQFHRLTDAAKRRLQEELILAAGPDTPLAAAIRVRRERQEGGS